MSGDCGTAALSIAQALVHSDESTNWSLNVTSLRTRCPSGRHSLFDFRSGFSYRSSPLHHFVLDERGELLRRRRRGIAAFGFEALLHVLQLERLLDVGM